MSLTGLPDLTRGGIILQEIVISTVGRSMKPEIGTSTSCGSSNRGFFVGCNKIQRNGTICFQGGFRTFKPFLLLETGSCFAFLGDWPDF